MALINFIDKYGLYDHHMKNIVVDITKNPDKTTLAGKNDLIRNSFKFLTTNVSII